MEGSVSGHHKSNHKGSSVEFAEYREYTPGEDPKRMDWRVLARTDRYFLKEFEAETNLRSFHLLDCSASMKFGKPSQNLNFQKTYWHLKLCILKPGRCCRFVSLATKQDRRDPCPEKSIPVARYTAYLAQAEASGKDQVIKQLHEVAESIKVEHWSSFIQIS